MTWSTLDNAASYLGTEIEKADWDFYSKTLHGAKKQRPAEERALRHWATLLEKPLENST